MKYAHFPLKMYYTGGGGGGGGVMAEVAPSKFFSDAYLRDGISYCAFKFGVIV